MYKATFINGTDILTLNKNGTYKHKYYVLKKAIVEPGKWEVFDSSENSEFFVFIILHQFNLRRKHGKTQKISKWVVGVEKSGRISFSNKIEAEVRVRICFEYDRDWCFIKVK